MSDRNSAFQTLKPCCVHLSQVSLSLSGQGGSADAVCALEDVLNNLKKVSNNPNVLDEKLAGYVFFPISQALRVSHKLSVRGLEIALQCLGILVRSGWKANLAPEMGIQLMILLTHLASGSTASAGIKNSSEELRNLAIDCLSAVFASISCSGNSKKALLDEANVPALSHCISIMLDAIVDGPSHDIQLSSTLCLTKLCDTVKSRDVLATFLPGIVSSLTKVITPNTQKRRSNKTIQACLSLTTSVLKYTLSDDVSKDLPEYKAERKVKELDKSWLQATAGQVKQALANILKIRNHFQPDVRFCLAGLCTTILLDCRQSLESCCSMVVETLVILSASDEDEKIKRPLSTIVSEDSKVRDILKTSLHNWILSLPRSMQSNDSASRAMVMRQISTSLRLLADSRVDISWLEQLVISNLRDGIVISLNRPKPSVTDPELSIVKGISKLDIRNQQLSPSFETVLFKEPSQTGQLQEVLSLIQILGSSNSFNVITRDLLRHARSSSGDNQVANFWVVLNLIEKSFDHNREFLDFIQIDSCSPDEMLYELYSLGLDILAANHTAEKFDWQLQALSLEAMALLASRQKLEFRGELIDALYPAIHLVGAANHALREHAICCINSLALSCGYENAGDMVISNVDYLVNAVSLKLNTFDISPQAPMVLVMMIRLSGASLLPFLDDLVESIFTALDSFHGYPDLVELLFSTLKAIAEEGAKVPQLALTNEDSQDRLRVSYSPPKTDALIKSIKSFHAMTNEREQSSLEKQKYPESPWNDENKSFDDIMNEKEKREDRLQEEEDNPLPNSSDPPPPVPATYRLLLNISNLTQHYVTSSSPSLRLSLLSLLDTTIPALAKHENSFLPFVNTIWPVLVSRLEDPEHFIQANTLDVISTMCFYGKDFMKGRVEEAWPKIRAISFSTSSITSGTANRKLPMSDAIHHKSLTAGQRDAHDLTYQSYVGPQVLMVQESLHRLYKAILERIQISESTFEDILNASGPILLSDDDMTNLLKCYNADAVWLYDLRTKGANLGERCNDINHVYSGYSWRFAQV